MGKNRNKKKKTMRKLEVTNSQVSNHSTSNGKPPEDGRSSGRTSRIKHQGDPEKNLRETSGGTVLDSSRPPTRSSNNKSKPPEDGRSSGRTSRIKHQGVLEKNLRETSGGTVLDSSRSTAHSSINKSRSAKDAESFEQKRNVPVIPRGKDTLLLLGFSDLEISSLSQEGMSIPCVQASKGKGSRLEKDKPMAKILGTENALDEPKVIGYTASPVQTLEPVCYEKNPVNVIRNNSFGETRKQKPHSSISGCSLNSKSDARDQTHTESSIPNCARDNKSRSYASIVKSCAFVEGTSESKAANADVSGAHIKTVVPKSSHGTSLTRKTESDSFRQTDNIPTSLDGYSICSEEMREYMRDRVESPYSVSSPVDRMEDNPSNFLADPYFEAKAHTQMADKFKSSVPQPRTVMKKGDAPNNGNLQKSLDTNQKKTNWELEKFTGAREKSKFSSSEGIAKTKKPLDGDNVDKRQFKEIHGKPYVTPKNEIKGNSNRRSLGNSKKCFEEEVHKWLSVRYKSIRELENLLLTVSRNERAWDNMQLNCKYGSVACKQSKALAPTWTWELFSSLGSVVCDVAGGLTSAFQMVSTDAIQSQFQQIMDADEVASKIMYEARSKYSTEYRYTVEITRKFGGTTLGETLCKISEAVGITEFFQQIKKANDNREVAAVGTMTGIEQIINRDTVEAAITGIGNIINRNCNREVGREVIDAVQGLVESNPACVGTVAGIGKSLYGAADLRMIPAKRCGGQFGELVKAGTTIVDSTLVRQEQKDIIALERKMRCGSQSKVEKDIREALNMLIQEKDEMLDKFSINYWTVP